MLLLVSLIRSRSSSSACCGVQARKDAAELLHDLQLLAAEEDLLAPGARRR